jgi:CheY-like chemotaxis protein
LLNLAVNARDAMPHGGSLSISLAVEREEEDEYVALSVSDSGDGIAPQHLPRIFEPFFTTKERGKGTGLGLASVYGIVKQSQGQIDVDSREGAGTTFRIRFPRVHAAPSRNEPPPVEVVAGSELVVLVDDDAEVRAVLLAHLESAGYAVLAAGGGLEALDLLARHRQNVRLLVSDVSMPAMSGIELARRTKLEFPALPILLISGYSEELQGDLQGQVRFLGKPFSRRSLLAEVRAALTQPIGSD